MRTSATGTNPRSHVSCGELRNWHGKRCGKAFRVFLGVWPLSFCHRDCPEDFVTEVSHRADAVHGRQAGNDGLGVTDAGQHVSSAHEAQRSLQLDLRRAAQIIGWEESQRPVLRLSSLAEVSQVCIYDAFGET